MAFPGQRELCRAQWLYKQHLLRILQCLVSSQHILVFKQFVQKKKAKGHCALWCDSKCVLRRVHFSPGSLARWVLWRNWTSQLLPGDTCLTNQACKDITEPVGPVGPVGVAPCSQLLPLIPPPTHTHFFSHFFLRSRFQAQLNCSNSPGGDMTSWSYKTPKGVKCWENCNAKVQELVASENGMLLDKADYRKDWGHCVRGGSRNKRVSNLQSTEQGFNKSLMME